MAEPAPHPVEAAPADTGASPRPPAERTRPGPDGAFLVDAVGLGLLALVLRLPAYLAGRHLTFDDGVFASSVIAMREGGVPFREVFSSQGPLFLPLAFLGDLLGGRTLDSPRVLAVASGVAVTVGLYWCARQAGDRLSGILAGLLGATSGCLMWVTGPLAADGPALAFAVLAFGTALRVRSRRNLPAMAALGALVGATVSTKSLEAPVLVPVALVLLWPLVDALRKGGRQRALLLRTVGEVSVSGLVAALVYVAASAPFGFAEVWDQSFRYRADAATDRDALGNAAKILSTLWDRDLVLLGFAVLTLAWATGSRIARPDRGVPAPAGSAVTVAATRPPAPTARLLVVLWALSSWVWLVFVVSPLWRPHVAAMVPPLVLAVAAWRPPARVLAVAAVLSLPLLWVQLDGLLRPGDYRGGEADVVARLRELPPGAWGLADEPGLLWRAGLRTTDDLVDPSVLRVRQGRYDEDSVVAAAEDPRVCAVVVRSAQRFGSFPTLARRLEQLGFRLELRDGEHGRLYLRTTCDPGS